MTNWIRAIALLINALPLKTQGRLGDFNDKGVEIGIRKYICEHINTQASNMLFIFSDKGNTKIHSVLQKKKKQLKLNKRKYMYIDIDILLQIFRPHSE